MKSEGERQGFTEGAGPARCSQQPCTAKHSALTLSLTPFCDAGAIFAPYVLVLPFFLPWDHLLGSLQRLA